MRLLFIGLPGAGKGTQADALSLHFGVPHISTGALFREHAARHTELGKRAQHFLDVGDLVPDDITNAMVCERLTVSDAAHGFIIDGYPRTLAQADVFTSMLKELGAELDAVVEFAVPEDELVRRMQARGRADDAKAIIHRRFEIYTVETAPLLDYYRDKLITLNAVGSIPQITQRVLAALKSET